MKFLINTTNLSSGGGLQVALNLLLEWNTQSPEHEFVVILSPQLDVLTDRRQFGSNFRFQSCKHNPARSVFHIWQCRRLLSHAERQFRPDAVLTVFGPALWTPAAPHLVGFANGFYLFEASDFIRKTVLPDIWKRIRYYLRRAMLLHQLSREADSYWVETEFARQKLAQVLDKPLSDIAVIGNTYGSAFTSPIPEPAQEHSGFSLLYVSAYYPHKHFAIIPLVIGELRARKANCVFLLTLSDTDWQKVFPGEQYPDYVRNVGPVPPTEIPALYQQADAVFLPSLLETFSANYPEAMKMNKPILCADRDFSRAACGEAALYFDPEDAAAIAESICTLMNDRELRARLIEKGKERLQQMETPSSRAQKLLTLLTNLKPGSTQCAE